MAVGTVTVRNNLTRSICLMTGQTANVAAPLDGSTASPAVPAYSASPIHETAETGAFFHGETPLASTLVISSSAGSGTMTGTFTLWCYCAATATWIPKTVNGGAAIGETSTDVIRFSQEYTDLGRFDAFYLELASIGGTATAFEAYLITGRVNS